MPGKKGMKHFEDAELLAKRKVMNLLSPGWFTFVLTNILTETVSTAEAQ